MKAMPQDVIDRLAGIAAVRAESGVDARPPAESAATSRRVEAARRAQRRYGESVRQAVLSRHRARDRVYFIQDTVGLQIKIGWAASVSRRLGELQPGNPHPLAIVGTVPGGHALEKQLHRTFAHLRLFGEWFSPGKELLAFIKENCLEGR